MDEPPNLTERDRPDCHRAARHERRHFGVMASDRSMPIVERLKVTLAAAAMATGNRFQYVE
jgi:hypothetical protein